MSKHRTIRALIAEIRRLWRENGELRHYIFTHEETWKRAENPLGVPPSGEPWTVPSGAWRIQQSNAPTD